MISVEDYLEGELISEIKREYLGGVVYAMAGARNLHNTIMDNTLVAVAFRLKGKRCKAHSSDTKVRIHLPTHLRFYYPDTHVTCDPNPPDDSFQDKPVVLFEVLSRSTRRIDEGEKKDAYLTIPSLQVYGMIEQDAPAMVVFRRTPNGFGREIVEGLDAVLNLAEIGIELPLREIYDGVEFIAEDGED